MIAVSLALTGVSLLIGMYSVIMNTTTIPTTNTTFIDATEIEQLCMFPYFPCGLERGDVSNPGVTYTAVSQVKVGGDSLQSGFIKVVSTVLKINAIFILK